MFANIYLNEIDQYVKNTLNAKYYFRYMDDSILLIKTKEEAMEEIQKLEQKVKTDIALKKIYEFSELKIIEVPGAIQLVVTTIVPKVMN